MTTPQTITSEIQKLAPSAVVEMFVLDTTNIGGDVYRFHAGTNGLRQRLVWQGETYEPFPVQVTGFEFNGSGQMPRPKMVVANVTGLITAMVLLYQDLLGAKLTRKRTLARYLDAVNFPGGTNATADATAEFQDDIFFIDRKTLENRDVVEFELAAAFDLNGVKLPRRQVIQNVCPWKYRGAECSYTGTTYFDVNDNPVGTLALDVCGKRLASCEKRFGANNELPFGGFPAAGLIR
jgi:lambda family phage minor tail protein L